MIPPPLVRSAAGVLVAALLLTALATLGCGEAADGGGDAEIEISISSAALGAAASRVVVAVRPGSGPEFPPFTETLVRNDSGWSGVLYAIPAGPGRQFDVTAFDALGAVLSSGSVVRDVLPGGIVQIAIALEPAARPAPVSLAMPVIDLLSVSRDSVAPRGTVELAVSARDPDGRPLGHRWVATCGSLDAPAEPATRWTAPDGVGRCRIALTVTTARGLSVGSGVAIDVRSAPLP